MKARRLALTVGAAGGGLLAAGFLQTAVAFADDYSIVPSGAEDFSSLGGFPPLNQSVTGFTAYDFHDATTGDAGSFYGLSLNDLGGSGLDHQQILVADHIAGATSPTGSLFDTVNYGNGFENLYSDVVGTDGAANTITDTFVTPFGNVDIPTQFDAAGAETAAAFTYPANSTVDLSYLPSTADNVIDQINSIGGVPLLDQTVSGTQLYDVDNATGDTVGRFTGVSLHDVNAFGQSNQEILATADIAKGFPAGNDPTPGSFFDTVNYGNGFENVYSDAVGTGTGGTNTITDTLVTPFGDLNVPTSFDAAAAATAAEFTFPAGSTAADYSFVPETGSPEDFTSIGGIPYLDQTFSGTQVYNVDTSAGNTVGSFDGVSTTDASVFGTSAQEILVTGDVGVSAAGAPEPSAGSLFDTINFGHGFENVYSDIVGSGTGATNTITDTFVTPFGDLNIPTSFDAFLALAPAEFTVPAATAAAELTTALNPADFTGLLADLPTALDPLSFLAF